MRTEETVVKNKIPRVSSPPPNTASLMEPDKGDPTIVKVDEAVKHNIGYIVEHCHSNGKLSYSKVLCENPEKKKGKERYILILLHKPTVEYALGSVITFQFGEYNGNPTATKVDLVTTKSPLADFFEYISNPDLVEESDPMEMSAGHLGKAFMTHTHVGVGNEAFKHFMVSQGIYTIFGWIGQRKIIARPL